MLGAAGLYGLQGTIYGGGDDHLFASADQAKSTKGLSGCRWVPGPPILSQSCPGEKTTWLAHCQLAGLAGAP